MSLNDSEANEPDADSPIQIRASVPRDLAALKAFLAPFVTDEHILPRSDDELKTLMANGFVAELGEQMVGFAAIEIYSQKLAEVQALAVSTSVQRRGVGTSLVERCVERAQSRGVLELMAITASEKLFRKAGFEYSLPNQKRALFVQTRESSD